jgi:hypothetical protein
MYLLTTCMNIKLTINYGISVCVCVCLSVCVYIYGYTFPYFSMNPLQTWRKYGSWHVAWAIYVLCACKATCELIARACARSLILGRIVTKFPCNIIRIIRSCMGYVLSMYMHCVRVWVRVHAHASIISKFVENILQDTRSCMGYVLSCSKNS